MGGSLAIAAGDAPYESLPGPVVVDGGDLDVDYSPREGVTAGDVAVVATRGTVTIWASKYL